MKLKNEKTYFPFIAWKNEIISIFLCVKLATAFWNIIPCFSKLYLGWWCANNRFTQCHKLLFHILFSHLICLWEKQLKLNFAKSSKWLLDCFYSSLYKSVHCQHFILRTEVWKLLCSVVKGINELRLAGKEDIIKTIKRKHTKHFQEFIRNYTSN